MEFPALLVSFILGITHAFEPDHVIAVATLVARPGRSQAAGVTGVIWCLGHTAALFVFASFLLLFKITVSDSVFGYLEMGVAVMLIFLGFRTIHIRHRRHLHAHEHDGITHTHEHSKDHHGSFLVGALHGAAGSGALIAGMIATADTVSHGLFALLLFGIGSMVGMSGMSHMFGSSLRLTTDRIRIIGRYLRIATGSTSVLFGCFMLLTLSGIV